MNDILYECFENGTNFINSIFGLRDIFLAMLVDFEFYTAHVFSN